jgi:hypothetical protein
MSPAKCANVKVVKSVTKENGGHEKEQTSKKTAIDAVCA